MADWQWQNEAVEPTCELRKWTRQDGGSGYAGTVFNDKHKIMEDGQPHHISPGTVKRTLDRGDHWLVITGGWKFKLLKTEEVVPK